MRTTQLAWEAAVGKAIIFWTNAKFFGQKPATKNEQKYLLNEKREFIPSSAT